MAAVTEDRMRSRIPGSLRQRTYQVDIANTGDTLTVTGFKKIEFVTTNDGAVTKCGVSGNVITFTTTGALTDVLVFVIGW